MNKVTITEVGPRDGFQSIKEFIPTEMKLKIIEGLIESNIKNMQITSFVHPKAIPQMKDSKEVCEKLVNKYPSLNFSALVPNFYGARSAVESGLKLVTYVTSVSESHNKANVNRTVEESIEEFKKIRDNYPDLNICFDVATAFGCPFEGLTPVEKVIDFVGEVVELGTKYINICDTIGVATPDHVKDLISKLIKHYPEIIFEAHIHDTRNMGMLNSLTAIEAGIHGIQTSVGGLGGCPFAPGASGNTSTEDLVYMLNRMGYDTGIDFSKLLEVAKYTRQNVDGNYSGHHINISKEHCIY